MTNTILYATHLFGYSDYARSGGRSYDFTYLVIIIILFIVSLIVQSTVKSRYKKYSKVFPSSGLSGAEAARRILDANGASAAMITTTTKKTLSDYFDPRTNTLYLSADTYNSRSISAIGVACHEAGHAIQAQQEYGPFKLRMMCVPLVNISTKIAMPLILIGLILSVWASALKYVALIGILLYAIAVIFQLITLPVEFDASHRALAAIRENGILNDGEMGGARKILSAAAMTYVVATLISVVQLLRFISIINRR